MDYYSQPLRNTLLNSGVDRRAQPRKRLYRRVTLGLSQGEIIQGQTIEVSVGGVGLMIHKPLPVNTVCIVRFDLMMNGVSTKIAAVGKVMSCACSGLEGFRIGVQLTLKDSQAITAVSTYVLAS